MLPTKNLLSFCMGFQGSVCGLCFTTDDGLAADYYAPFVEGPKPSNAQIGGMPLSWKRCGENASKKLKEWLGSSVQARGALMRAA